MLNSTIFEHPDVLVVWQFYYSLKPYANLSSPHKFQANTVH